LRAAKASAPTRAAQKPNASLALFEQSVCTERALGGGRCTKPNSPVFEASTSQVNPQQLGSIPHGCGARELAN
jgi:hypothetical protein